MSILTPKSLTKKLLTKRKRHGPSEAELAKQREASIPKYRRDLSDTQRASLQRISGMGSFGGMAMTKRVGGKPIPSGPTMTTMPVRETAMPKPNPRPARPPAKPPALETRPMPKPNPRPTRPIAKPPAPESEMMFKPKPRRRIPGKV